MKHSGAYWTLTDQSFKTGGSSRLQGVFALLTTKGKVGELNEVTADTLEDVLGYDLAYNGNYLGLKKALDAVPYLEVLRLNQGAARANIYDNASAVASVTGLSEGDSLESGTTFNLSLDFEGKDHGHYVKIEFPTTDFALDIPEPASGSYTITIPSALDLSKECFKYNGEYYSGAVFQEDNTIIGVIASDGKIYSIVDEEVSEDQIGTLSGTTLTLDTAKVVPTGVLFYLEGYETSSAKYTLVHAISDDGENFKNIKKYNFSTNESSEIYYEKVDFGEIVFYLTPNSSFNYSLLEDYVELLNGSNGSMPKAGQININLLDDSAANICVLPGITDVAVVNKFAAKCDSLIKSLFIGVPEFPKYVQANSWCSSLLNTEYMQVAWISDEEDTEVGTVYVSPAVNLFLIYADMYNTQGSLNYPPAGYSYGNISITKLMKTDFALHRDELKTNRINYQMVGPRGPVMWEDRTRYGDETDLSYANTVFIMRDLRERILNYAISFNFQYTSPTMLTVFGSGLRTILENMQEEGFLSNFELHVPSFDDAQKSGRTLKVHIGVAVMQDAQLIEFDVVLKNYADVAA